MSKSLFTVLVSVFWVACQSAPASEVSLPGPKQEPVDTAELCKELAKHQRAALEASPRADLLESIPALSACHTGSERVWGFVVSEVQPTESPFTGEPSVGLSVTLATLGADRTLSTLGTPRTLNDPDYCMFTVDHAVVTDLGKDGSEEFAVQAEVVCGEGDWDNGWTGFYGVEEGQVVARALNDGLVPMHIHDFNEDGIVDIYVMAMSGGPGACEDPDERAAGYSLLVPYAGTPEGTFVPNAAAREDMRKRCPKVGAADLFSDDSYSSETLVACARMWGADSKALVSAIHDHCGVPKTTEACSDACANSPEACNACRYGAICEKNTDGCWSVDRMIEQAAWTPALRLDNP